MFTSVTGSAAASAEHKHRAAMGSRSVTGARHATARRLHKEVTAVIEALAIVRHVAAAGLWVSSVAAACPSCARAESPNRALLVFAMVLGPLVCGAVATYVLVRLGTK
jgi:hypothetical protein